MVRAPPLILKTLSSWLLGCASLRLFGQAQSTILWRYVLDPRSACGRGLSTFGGILLEVYTDRCLLVQYTTNSTMVSMFSPVSKRGSHHEATNDELNDGASALMIARVSP